MATKYLSDDDTVVRHIPYTSLIRDDDEKVIGVFPQAFRLRPDEKYLSASWLEFCEGTKQERLKKVAEAIGTKRKVKPSQGFALGNVGDVSATCADFDVKIRVSFEPKEHAAYTAIRNYRSDSDELLMLLASEAWAETISAADCL